MKVVIADDTEEVLETTGMVLELAGHDVHLVSDAADILDVVEAERPDVLLQDVSMPGLDLDALLRSVRTGPSSDTRIVVFTGHRPTQEEVAQWRPDAVIHKPFDVEHLRQTIASLGPDA